MISYWFVYNRSSKPVMKGCREETIEAARKEYKQLLEEGCKKDQYFYVLFLMIKVYFPTHYAIT